MSLLLAAGFVATMPPPAALSLVAATLASRLDQPSTEAAIEALASLATRPEASPHVAAALLRFRYFLVEEYLDGTAQVRTDEETVAAGLRHLSPHVGVELRTFTDLDRNLHSVPRVAAGLLFWSTVSFSRTIESLPLLRRWPAARRFRRAIDRVLALQEDYFYGGPRRVLALYLVTIPKILGGSDEQALPHVQRAIEIAPHFATNNLFHAEVLRRSGDDERYRKALRRALGLGDDSVPGSAVEQKLAKDQARELRAGLSTE